MEWWMWVLLGLGLLALELLVPGGFIFLFFGISAIVVGLMVALGLLGTHVMQWLFFSVFSIIALLALRKPLRARFAINTVGAVDSVTHEIAIAQDEFAVDGTGQVEFRGSPWNAKNVGGHPIAKGQRCHVKRIEGLTLYIQAE